MLAIKKSTIHCLWECKYEYSMERLSKIKHKLAIPLLDNFLKKTEPLIQKGYTNSYVHQSNIYNS